MFEMPEGARVQVRSVGVKRQEQQEPGQEGFLLLLVEGNPQNLPLPGCPHLL